MFEVSVGVLIALAVAIAVLTFVSVRRAGRSVAAWPYFGLAAFVLIEARAFVDTPSLSEELQAKPSVQTVSYIDDRVSDLFVGGGLTALGIACAGVFFAGLAVRARATMRDSIAPWLIAIGGAATVAIVGTGAGFFLILADAASSDRAPTTVATIYTIFDSLGYMGFTAVGLVTAGVALASFRESSFSRAVGWVSAVATGIFVLCTFVPFLSWAPALLWLLVVGILLVRAEGRADRTQAHAAAETMA